MPDLVIFKDDTGQLEGFGEKGRRAWLKFRKLVADLEPGEMLQFGYRLPRSPKHHRYFFARLGELFALQERFEDEGHLLEWLKVGAGHVDFVPGRDGQIVAMPRSIAWANLDEQGFIEFTRAMNDFLWTPHAQEFLWPALTPVKRSEMLRAWYDGRGGSTTTMKPLPKGQFA